MISLLERFVNQYGRLPTEVDPDYLEMLRMTKYRIMAVPDFKPGKCANCGASKNDGRKYADFGCEVDWYGTVFLCGLCLKDIADAMGLFKEMEDKLKATIAALDAIQELDSKGVHLQERITDVFRELSDHYSNLYALRVNGDPIPGIDLGSDETAGEQRVDSPESEPIKTESRITKSSASSGRKNISSLAELLSEPD